MKLSVRSTVVRVLLAAAFAGAVFAATSSAASSVDAAAAKLVPAKIKAKGTVVVAADASYAPNEFIGSDGHTVVGMDADLAKAIFPLLGLKVNVVNATFDDDHPGPRVGQVRRRHVVVHRQQVAREAGQLRRLLQGRHVVLREGVGRPEGHQPRQHLRPHGLGRDRHDRADRRERADDEVHEGRQEARQRAALPDAVGREPRALERPCAGRAWPTRRSPPTRSSSPTASSSSIGQSYGVAPYGIAVPKRTARSTRRSCSRCKDLIKSGKYASILTKWGVQSGADTHAGAERRDLLGRRRGRCAVSAPDAGSAAPGRHQGRPGPPPGALGGGRDRACRRGRDRQLDGDQPALRLGPRRPLPVRRADHPRRRRHDRADARGPGARRRARRAARRDAALAQPAVAGGQLALRVVLPRHAGARAAAVLVRRHRRALPDDQPRRSRSGPQFVHINSNIGDHADSWPSCSRSGSTRARTCRRSCAPGSSRSTRARAEAAHSLGMTRLQTMRRIVLPQAMRVIIPPTGNETISMLKTTSLALVVAGTELFCGGAEHLQRQLRDHRAADRRVALVPRDDVRCSTSASTTSSATSHADPRASCRRRRCRRSGAACSRSGTTRWRWARSASSAPSDGGIL